MTTGHIRIIAESDVLQGRCFHSYDDELYAKERERAEIAEEEGGRGIKEVLMSIVGSGRGSLWGGSGRVTLLGGSGEFDAY